MLDPPEVRSARSTDGAEDRVALLEKEFAQIRAVLARYAGD
jgi:hypothetical protein